MRARIAAFALLALLAQGAGAAEAPAGRTVTLSVPATWLEGRYPILEVAVGALPSGAEIDVTGPSGERLGTISPFNLKAGAGAGTFTIPLPPSTVKDGHVTVTLSLRVAGASRVPTADEVKGVVLVQGPKLPD